MRTEVAQAQDAPAVGDHNDLHIVRVPVVQDLAEAPALRVRIEEHPHRLPVGHPSVFVHGHDVLKQSAVWFDRNGTKSVSWRSIHDKAGPLKPEHSKELLYFVTGNPIPYL